MLKLTQNHILLCIVAFAVVTPRLIAGQQQQSHEQQQQQQEQPIWEATHGPITQLPGYAGELRSKHYGGYISLGSKQLYYYMVESERSPATDPVVLWLNGGPGCSSFDGFIYEQGPFLYSMKDSKTNSSSSSSSAKTVALVDNPFAWNKVATMIFLDSPSPVGLSFSLNKTDYSTNDTQTARDSHAVLRALFSRHPQLQANDFYISGESYAGMYIPMLAREVVEGNIRGQQPHINIKGYLVGNGVTDDEFDGNAYLPFAAGKSLISELTLQRASQACGGHFWNGTRGSRCDEAQNEVWTALDNINIYNVLEKCHFEEKAAAPSIRADRRRRMALLLRQYNRWPLRPVLGKNETVHNWATLLGENPPCVVSPEADTWLNDPAVRSALHAAPHTLTGPWKLCSSRIRYRSDGGSMLPVHDALVRKHGLRALIYSGDHDMAVPHTGSEAWTAAMHRSNDTKCSEVNGSEDRTLVQECDGVTSPWQSWYNSDSPPQVAGFAVVYNSGLTYATIKGAGHMVPQTNPREALDMFSRFLAGQPLNSATNRVARTPDA